MEHTQSREENRNETVRKRNCGNKQAEHATACASLETWNEKMNCWVNRGAKGIALIDTDSERPRLKYVFDVSDVHKARRIGRAPYLWELIL